LRPPPAAASPVTFCHHSGMTEDARTLPELPDPQALLFDLDGTLVDTLPVRAEAWRRASAQFGLSIDPAILPRLLGSDGRW
jgi:hypothetical protein